MTKINILCQLGEENKKHLGAMEGKLYKFQKRNKLKTPLGHVCFQAKTPELQGVRLWCKVLNFLDLNSGALRDKASVTSVVSKGSLCLSQLDSSILSKSKFIYLMKCKVNLALIFDSYTVTAIIC